jgi:hypothetical protein
MKPSDHPDFFRFPAPEGRSRESTIVLDREGRFWHEGALVEHPKLAAAMHTWIGRHPDDGRYILTNGYDWTYFTVEDAPYFVNAVRIETAREGPRASEIAAVRLVLSDATEEEWRPAETRIGDGGALYTRVHFSSPGGPFDARFTRHAQASLAPVLVDEHGKIAARIGGSTFVLRE